MLSWCVLGISLGVLVCLGVSPCIVFASGVLSKMVF